MRKIFARHLLAVSLLVSIALPAVARADTKFRDSPFEEAAEQHRKNRSSEAYGRFLTLANLGDRDAARIALFMYRYGPSLYGTHWDASTDEIELWEQLANQGGRATPKFRSQPVFRPLR